MNHSRRISESNLYIHRKNQVYFILQNVNTFSKDIYFLFLFHTGQNTSPTNIFEKKNHTDLKNNPPYEIKRNGSPNLVRKML